MKNSNSGYQCEHFTYEDVKSLVINFNERFPESFSMEEFSQTGEMQYLKGKSGDVILLPFETISGNYRAEVTCDGGVDIAPGVSS
ncbi:hypothetical protein [Vreelandella glaciei]|uniref:hypothetical protein n=1 Tax=Vreelandella glaciei TaxID=186761 RepID=UPI0030EC2BF7